jgi:hypothetical protein
MKKIALLALVLVVLLGSLGVGYAHWRDTIYIDGTVEMGTVNISFDGAGIEPPVCSEFHEDPVGSGIIKPGEYLGKDVGSCEAWMVDYEEDVHSGKWGYETVKILIKNAYPSYRAHTTFVVHNIGTVPVNIISYVISGVKQDKAGTKVCDLVFVDLGNYDGYLFEDYDGDGNQGAGEPEVINLRVINNILPYQLDPCNTEKSEVDLHFKQEAQQCHTYLLKMVITAQQWNLD